MGQTAALGKTSPFNLWPALGCSCNEMGKTKSLHIYWWELDAVGRFSFFDGKVLIDTQKLNKHFFLSFPYVCFWFCVQNLIWFIIKSPIHQNIIHLLVFMTRKYAIMHLCETATNSAKIHSLARKLKEYLCINQIQLRFLHFYQHSITLLVIHMCHSAYKRDQKIYFH